jgi:phosphatidyl-myo-inositol dimannoside synthase
MADALMVTTSFLPGRGGIESYLAELCDRLSPRLAVLAPARREGKPIPSDLPYPATGGPGRMLAPTSRVTNAVVHEARRQGTDRILFGTPWPLALLGPQLRARGLRYAVIVHGAELVVPGAVPLLRRRLARALSQADLLLPVSDYTASAVRGLLQQTGNAVPPIELLRARVDTERFRPDRDSGPLRARLGIGEGTQVILCFGRLVPRKGVHRLVAAMPRIARRVPQARLVVGGTGPELSKLQRQAAKIDAAVTFAGRVADEDAPALYATADVFALPVVDRWFGLEIEGLGVVLLEASACEAPCVTGRSGGTPEAVIDGQTGFVIDAKDEDALVDRVVRLLEDDTLRSAMGTRGRRHVQEHFAEAALPRPLLEWLDEGIPSVTRPSRRRSD